MNGSWHKVVQILNVEASQLGITAESKVTINVPQHTTVVSTWGSITAGK
jgi:hypothetical protein